MRALSFYKLKRLASEAGPTALTEEQVWVQAWCAVASASDCRNSDVPATWADKCLAEFKKRFREKGMQT